MLAAIPCGAADALGFPRFGSADGALLIFAAGNSTVGAAVGFTTLALSLAAAFGTGCLGFVDGADGGDGEHGSLLLGEFEAPSEGIGCPALGIGNNTADEITAFGDSEPGGPCLDPVVDVPARMGEAGEMVDGYEQVLAAGIVVRQDIVAGIPASEQDAEIAHAQADELHGRWPPALALLLLGEPFDAGASLGLLHAPRSVRQVVTQRTYESAS
jgi:hypothetical protein